MTNILQSIGNKPILVLALSLLLTSCVKESVEIVNTDDIVLILPNAKSSDKESETTLAPLEMAKSWVKNMQRGNGLLESAEHTNFVSLYDNALAAIVYIESRELESAERIFDFFHSKMNDELLHGTGGFYQFRNGFGEEGSRTWMGDNAWLLIALNSYYAHTQDDTYLTMAQEIEQWLRGLQDSDGGLWGGYNENGTVIPKVTEGIITAFHAVQGYDAFHQNLLLFLKNERWDAQNNILMAWPENETYTYALDLHSLGSLIFDHYGEQGLAEAERFLTTQTLTVSGADVTGYCFDEDRDVVWLEGTAQMAVAFNANHAQEESEDLLLELEKSMIGSSITKDAMGFPYASNQGTNYGPNPLWDHADLTPTLSTTAWYIFAKTGISPLDHNKKTAIPENDIFW